MRRFWLTIWYGFEDFMNTKWWLAIILIATIATPFVLSKMGMRAPSEPTECVRYSSFAEAC